MCITNTTSRRIQAISLAPETFMSKQFYDISSEFVLPTSSSSCAAPISSAAPFVTPNNVNGQDKKRQRKPPKPGKTAKNHERHFVVHDYHDHANDLPEHDLIDGKDHKRPESFPHKLHQFLEQVELDGFSHVISWQPHGRCFVIHKPKEFADHVTSRYFKQSKLTSFQRQLNLYGFSRLTRGADAGGYYHELFLRGKEFLCNSMVRTKVKGTRIKAANNPDAEPDFYKMTPLLLPAQRAAMVTPVISSVKEEQMAALSQQPPPPLQISSQNLSAIPYVPDVVDVEQALPALLSQEEELELDQFLQETFGLDRIQNQASSSSSLFHDGSFTNASHAEQMSLSDMQLGMLLELFLVD